MLQIAKVLKSNGTEGEVLLGFRDFYPEDIDTKEPVYIYFDGLPVPFFIQSIAPKGTQKAVVRLCDVDSLRDAEELVGAAVWLDAEQETDTDEDFVGWQLLDKGHLVGTVTGIEPIPGNLCLYVGDILIPLHPDFVLSLDPSAKTMDLDLPEGLY